MEQDGGVMWDLYDTYRVQRRRLHQGDVDMLEYSTTQTELALI